MRFLYFISMAITILSSQKGFARNFYKTYFYLAAEYANLDTGREKMFSGESVHLHYSDDKAFCRIYFKRAEYPCFVSEFRNSVGYPIVTIQREVLLKFFNELAQSSGASEKAKSGFCRLISQLPEGFIIHSDSEYRYQFHDEFPESIHVEIDSLRIGTAI